MSGLAPGKGIFLDFPSPEVAKFISGALGTAAEAAEDNTPEGALKWLVEECGWRKESDTFGEKAYIEFPIDEATRLRVTVIIRRGKLKLDLRTWFTP